MSSYFASGAPADSSGDTPTSGLYDQPLGPVAPPPPTYAYDTPIGPSYEPQQDWLLQNKWYLLAGAGAVFLLAGGSILGLSLRKKRRGRR